MSVYSTDNNGNARIVANVGGGSGGSADFPAGGTTGQALVKASNTDNDVEWGNMPNIPIEKITVNGIEQTITNKTVALTVIDNTVNNLVNYYKKTETYTQTEVNNLISAAAFGGFQVVSSLPAQDISTKTIYLVSKTVSETNNVYDEFIYVNNSWENIGDTEIDLTVYQTKNLSSAITVGGVSQTTVEAALSAINALFASYMTTSAFNTTIADYYTKTQVDATTGDLSNLATTNKTNLVSAINELNAASRPRSEVVISAATGFRSAGQGAYSFKTSTAVTITLADANTITIPANIQGIFDVGATDATLNDYIGLIQYTLNGYEKKIYFTSSVFYLPATDSVQIDDTTPSSSTTYSSSKIETVIGSAKASQMTGATSYQDGKEGLATKPLAGDNQKALFGDGKYHSIYAANTGSTIVVTTDEPTLYGRTVTLTAGSTTLTGTFSNTGECTFTNLAVYGSVQVASEDSEGSPARGSTNITYFGTYVVGIGFNFATIKFTSSDISLAGEPVAVYHDGLLVAETSLRSTGYGELEAVCYVEQLGTYKAICQTTEGTARASINVLALRQVYTKELTIAEIYGFKINKTDSNPATCVSVYDGSDYDVQNESFAPAYMNYTSDSFVYGSWGALETGDRNSIFFAPKPCMLGYNGEVDYYLDPTDFTKKADGTASDITDMSYPGNVMIEFPTIWFRRWEDASYTYVIIASKQLDTNFKAYAHHDINGNVLPYIYLAAFNGSYDGTRMRSISDIPNNNGLASGKILNTITRQQVINFATANNDSNEQGEGHYMLHKADRDMINDLLILIGMNTNTQSVFGKGSTTALTTGTLKSNGMFYGANTTAKEIKILGIENWWGFHFKQCAGYINSTGSIKVKMTYGQEDGSETTGYNLTGTGYIAISNFNNSAGWLNTWKVSDLGMIPTSTGGSATTYLCDYQYVNNGKVCWSMVNGSNGDEYRMGAFANNCDSGIDEAYVWFGASLTYKGIAS